MTGHQLRSIQTAAETPSVCKSTEHVVHRDYLLLLHLRNTLTYLLAACVQQDESRAPVDWESIALAAAFCWSLAAAGRSSVLLLTSFTFLYCPDFDAVANSSLSVSSSESQPTVQFNKNYHK